MGAPEKLGFCGLRGMRQLLSAWDYGEASPTFHQHLPPCSPEHKARGSPILRPAGLLTPAYTKGWL